MIFTISISPPHFFPPQFSQFQSLIPNSAPHTHQYGPNKVSSHTTEPSTTMYSDWLLLIILITITLASSNNTLPDDGD